MGQPDGLVEWLRRVLDARERQALAVKPLGHVVDMGGVRIDDHFTHARMRHRAEDGARYVESDGAAQEHFADNDPARVLAEVAAHRAILAEHAPLVEHVEWWDAPDSTGQAPVCTSCRPADPTEGDYDPAVKPEDFVPSYTLWPCPTVRHIATVYADREGRREEWRPA